MNGARAGAIQPGFGNGAIPANRPNGRRFGDDVADIAVSALISDLHGPLVIRVADGVDGINRNDSRCHKVFPQGGRSSRNTPRASRGTFPHSVAFSLRSDATEGTEGRNLTRLSLRSVT